MTDLVTGMMTYAGELLTIAIKMIAFCSGAFFFSFNYDGSSCFCGIEKVNVQPRGGNRNYFTEMEIILDCYLLDFMTNRF